jgi:hypothetical protein
MAFNVEKCHLLSVTRKRSSIPPSYTLHGQTLESVRDAKHLGVNITNNLHWGNDVWSVAAKATTISAFTHRNLKGCTTNVQTHCYRIMVRPILEYASSVWDPHQQGLVSAFGGSPAQILKTYPSGLQPTNKRFIDGVKIRPRDTRAGKSSGQSMHDV